MPGTTFMVGVRCFYHMEDTAIKKNKCGVVCTACRGFCRPYRLHRHFIRACSGRDKREQNATGGNSDIRPVPRPLCKGFSHRVP